MRIMQRNYRCRGGEIDLIARDGETLVFVEVKTRTRGSGELPEASLTARKRHRLARAASAFMREHRVGEVLYRFDLVGCEVDSMERWTVLHWRNIIDYRKARVRRF
jgi:putative endonuclease